MQIAKNTCNCERIAPLLITQIVNIYLVHRKELEGSESNKKILIKDNSN